MSKYLVLLSTLRVVLADYDLWAPVDNTVTKILSRTVYVCPCDGSTSYDPNWNVWEGPKTDMSGSTKTGSDSNTWTKTITTPVSAGTPSTSTAPSTFTIPSTFATPSTFSTQCYTTMGTNSAPYGTSWSTSYTSYTSCTSTVTSTINTTTTLSATSTVTATITTTTTAPTNTLTSTATETDTATSTTTGTVIVTTTTTTTTTSTSTVAASSGFVPVQSSLPGSSYSGSGGADPVAKRALAPAHAAGVSRYQNSTNLLGFLGHPNGVSCIQWAPKQCNSVTTTVTSTQTQSVSTTITTTMTTTSTSTVVPSATTTVTTTITTTNTISATTTTTSTETDTATTSTSVYAACATNNLADTVNGQIIGNAENSDTGITRVITSANTAYDCCVAALLTPNSDISGFVPSNGATNNCILFTSDTCSNGQLTTQWQADTGDQGIGQITLNNQNCGIINSSD